MDFFERQHSARRNTRKFVFLFCLVMVVISFANHLIVSVTFGVTRSYMDNGWLDGERIGWFGFVLHYFLNLKSALVITFCTATVLLLLALYKYL